MKLILTDNSGDVTLRVIQDVENKITQTARSDSNSFGLSPVLRQEILDAIIHYMVKVDVPLRDRRAKDKQPQEKAKVLRFPQ